MPDKLQKKKKKSTQIIRHNADSDTIKLPITTDGFKSHFDPSVITAAGRASFHNVIESQSRICNTCSVRLVNATTTAALKVAPAFVLTRELIPKQLALKQLVKGPQQTTARVYQGL